jgi:hypothetical protein
MLRVEWLRLLLLLEAVVCSRGRGSGQAGCAAPRVVLRVHHGHLGAPVLLLLLVRGVHHCLHLGRVCG